MRMERELLRLVLPVPVSTLAAVERGLRTMKGYVPDRTFMRQEQDHLVFFEAVDTLKDEPNEPSTPA